MINATLKTPQEIQREIALRAQAARLLRNMSQKVLAERSGVSLGSVKRFEATGDISLTALLSVALVLNALDAFAEVFPLPPPENLFKLEESTVRKRARSLRHES